MAERNEEEARNALDLATLSRGVGVNLLALFSKLGRPAFYLLAARLYSTASYGLYYLAWTWVNLFSRFAFFGLDKALLRQVAHHQSRDEKQRALGCVRTALFAGGVLSLVVSLGCFLFSDALGVLIGRERVGIALRWMAFVVFFQTAGGLLLQIPIAHKVMEYQLYVKGLTEPALLIGFAVLFYLFGMDLTGICAAYLIATAIVFCCSILPVFRFYPWRTWSWKRVGSERQLVRLSLSMFLIDLIAELNGRLDVVIVGSFIEPETIAVYGVMIQLAGVVRAVSGAFDPIANPFFAEYHARGEISRLNEFFKLVTRWVALVAIPVLLVFALNGSRIAAIVGSEFSSGYPWLLILLPGAASTALLGLSGYVLVMTGHPDALIGARVLTLLISGIGTFVLVRRFGPTGAAIGAAFTAILSSALSSWWVFRRLGVHAFSIKLCKPLLAGFATAALMLAYGSPGPTAAPWNVLGHAGLVFTCFGGFLLLLGVEAEEKQFGLRVYRRIRRIFAREEPW